MRFTLRRACPDCPFRRSRRFPLRRARIADLALDRIKYTGAVFPCHKTTSRQQVRWQACAGWLLFGRGSNQPNQLLQIAERLGLYRPGRIENDGDILTAQEIRDANWFT